MNIVERIINKARGTLKTAEAQGMKVGQNVTVMSGVNFGSEPYLITIGNNVRISSYVAFINHDGGTWAFRDLEEYKDVIKYGRISIGDNTFIGSRTVILPGVSIGKRCVIGTGSVVTKSIPDGSVACGVPAKVIMSTIEYAEKSKQNMQEYDKKAYLANKRKYLEEWLK